MSGGVVWITGLSGAGKTTVARELMRLFEKRGRFAILLDGDEIREAIGDTECGHDAQSRLVNAYRICRLAKMIADQGCHVVVATMSLFHEIHAWNRDNFPNYCEVFLDVDVETLKERDSKGHYARGRDLPSVDIKPQFPLNPHVALCNHGFTISAQGLATSISDQLS